MSSILGTKSRIYGSLSALATAIAVAVSVLTPIAVLPAQAATTWQFVPIRLTVYDIEDGWPDSADEPRMYYGPGVWADVVKVGGYKGSIAPVTFTGATMSIDLWERDGGWTDHNHLGYQTVDISMANQERSLRFRNSSYDYELTYKIIRA